MQIRYARLRISKLYYNPRGRGILPYWYGATLFEKIGIKGQLDDLQL